jgi:ketosteroid isomerase-like protein
MTEQINRQCVLDLLDDFAAGDVEAALERCTDDVDFLTHAPIDILTHMGPRRGKAEIGEMWRTVKARYSSIRYEAPIMVAEGDKVAAYLRAFFTKQSNERVVQFDVAVFYTFRDGRIAQIREIIDSFDLVQQVLETDVAAVLAENRQDKA